MNYKLKKMKKLNVIVVLLVVANMSFAQPKKEKIEAQKIAFITNAIDLTTEEAQQFWPVYNEFSDKTDAIRQKKRSNFEVVKENWDEISDSELDKTMSSMFDYEQEELDLKKSYHEKFKSVLSVKKVAKLYRAEEMFKRELLKRMRGGKDDRRRPRSPERP